MRKNEKIRTARPKPIDFAAGFHYDGENTARAGF